MNSFDFQKRKVRRLNWIKLFFFLSLLLAFAFLIIKINNMFISVLLAIVLFQILRPPVDFLEEKVGISRFWSTLFIFSIFGSLSISFFTWTLPFLTEQFRSLRSEIPSYISEGTSILNQIEDKIRELLPVQGDIGLIKAAQDFLFSQMTQIVQDLPKVITNSFSIFFLSSFLAFFMVKDSHSIMKGFLSLVPNHVFTTTLSLTHQINNQIGRFIRVRIIEACLVGLVTGVGLQFISFPFALLLGMFAGVMNLIPYLGPLIGFIPALFIGLMNGLPLTNFLTVVSVYVIAQVIDNVLIIPFFVARMMKLHPVTVIIVVTAGAQFMGILGMIISIPVASAIQVSYQSVYQHIINAESVG